MADLVLRSVTALPPTGYTYTTKGAALTYFEIDNNFIELDTEIHNIELALPEVADNAPPGVPGKIWYNTQNDKTYIYDGATGTWLLVGDAPITFTAGTPTGGSNGDRWVDTSTGISYVFDGAAGLWRKVGLYIEINNIPPIAPYDGQQWFDLLNQEMKLWDGNQWIVTSGTKIIDGLNDVISTTVLAGQLLEWDPTAVDADGRVGQWVATHVLDASPDGGATDDF